MVLLRREKKEDTVSDTSDTGFILTRQTKFRIRAWELLFILTSWIAQMNRAQMTREYDRARHYSSWMQLTIRRWSESLSARNLAINLMFSFENWKVYEEQRRTKPFLNRSSPIEQKCAVESSDNSRAHMSVIKFQSRFNRIALLVQWYRKLACTWVST